jgi:FkbM family methyltransferase
MIVRMRRIDFRPENISGSFLRSVEAFNGEYIDFIKRERISTVIEGGIGDGSNSVIFLDLFPKSIIYGFDPFTEAYLKGGHRVNLEGSGRIKRYPYALWDRCQDINLLVNRYNYQGARIVKGREGYGRLKNVKAVSVDHFVRKNNIKKVDYIKLDIEGAEMKALEGAKNTLASHRPQLAVCVYHKKEDLFEIPIFLAKVLKDYVYRIGHYTTSLWGTVLYAIPGECYKKTAFADVYTHARR